jgi:nicotinamidase-related amidase
MLPVSRAVRRRRLDGMTRALVVVDVQESFRARPSWETISDPRITHRVNRLVRLARAAGETVVWVLHTEPGSGDVFDPALGHVRLMDGLEVREEDPVVHKTTHGAMTPQLRGILAERGVDELVLCGIRTEQCVETTARVASDLGHRVVLVIDATATHPIPGPGAPAGRSTAELLADPATLGVAEIIERTEYALRGRFASIVTVDQLAAAAVTDPS